MNLLVDDIDNVVSQRINLEKFRTDFRISILFELLMQDPNIKKEDKILKTLVLFYTEPKYVTEIGLHTAIDNALWFYRCGKEEENDDNNEENDEKKVKQIYSFEFDDKYIYAAFLDQYNINLQQIEYLHWWEFKAMFDGLKEENQIVKIMGYRATDLSKIKDKEEKKRYKKLKDLYALPDMRSDEEKEADFAESLW